MKVRIAFVSNSSTSSFLVSRLETRGKEPLTPARYLISKHQEVYLLDRGYQYTFCRYPSCLKQEDLYPSQVDSDKEASFLGLNISCNQDNEICFLLRHKISFLAAIEYNHYQLFYHQGDDFVLSAPNWGLMLETYGIKFFNEGLLHVGITKTPIDNWLYGDLEYKTPKE